MSCPQDDERQGEEGIVAVGNQREDGRQPEDQDHLRPAAAATPDQAEEADRQQAEINQAG